MGVSVVMGPALLKGWILYFVFLQWLVLTYAHWVMFVFQVDCLVCTAGGIEEDLMKCLAPSYLGSFSLQGKELRKKGINRIGNLLVPNDNYVKFEEWINPIWDEMLEEQKNQVTILLSISHHYLIIIYCCSCYCCCFVYSHHVVLASGYKVDTI